MRNTLRVGMVGAGMIFDETYRPAFIHLAREPLFTCETGPVSVVLAGIASRSGRRASEHQQALSATLGSFILATEPNSVGKLLEAAVDCVCVATPDDRHYAAAAAALEAGKHVLIEKPSVLSLAELDSLTSLARSKGVLAKVVYHKLLDPDHKKLRTFVVDGVLKHCHSGYCSLLEPKSIATGQFSEWITGRNPGTYVAVHYVKLIDFTFGGRLRWVQASGQRGLVGPANGPTWDAVQLRLIYEHDNGRQAAFDIHTSWIHPDNFPGYVEQEVQFRFDNGVWNGHSRKRGVELTVEDATPTRLKSTLNNHYNGAFLEPWGERTQRGYGVEVIERFFREVAYVEFGGPSAERSQRLAQMTALSYNDLTAERQVVAAVQALEAILQDQVGAERPVATVAVNHPEGGLVLLRPGESGGRVLYEGRV